MGVFLLKNRLLSNPPVLSPPSPLHPEALALPIPEICGEAVVKGSYFRLLLGAGMGGEPLAICFVAIRSCPVLLVLCLKQNKTTLHCPFRGNRDKHVIHLPSFTRDFS